MISQLRYFDLLGIDRKLLDRAALAAALWPKELISTIPGVHPPNDDDAKRIAQDLFDGTVFRNLRPGVAPSQISFAADMDVVGPLLTNNKFYLSALPDLGILLKPTAPAHPAHIFFAADGRGHEIIIDRLPVTLFLKPGLASAIPEMVPEKTAPFDNTAIDSFAYRLGDETVPAEIDCFVRLQLTVEGDVILEPTVPLSFGRGRWFGLPANALYDLQLLPSPGRRDYMEWAHNDLGSFFAKPLAKGAVGFRSIDLDFAPPPFYELRERLQKDAVNIEQLELVLEDVVMPVTVPMLPVPSHGTFGFRRSMKKRGEVKQAFSLETAPVRIPIYGSPRQAGNGGTSLTLQVERFFFRTGEIHACDPTDEPQVRFDAALIFQTKTGKRLGPAMGIDDEWTLTAGMVIDIADTPVKMTIADAEIGLVGLKLGVSLGRLARHMPFADSFVLLGDLYVRGKAGRSSTSGFQITSASGNPLSIVIRDLGYKLGHFSVEQLQMPDGMQIVFCQMVHIIVEEMGWVEETNGTPYFSFSGGVAIGGAGTGNSGIRVRRLRFRLNRDNSQPLFKLDGIFLKLAYGPAKVDGFGYISDYTADGWAIKEWGFGVRLELTMPTKKFLLAAAFVKGSRTRLDDASQYFDYFLAALEVGYVPAGPVGLYKVKALFADNMAPNLTKSGSAGEDMALLKWYQNSDDALSVLPNRALPAWIAKNGALDLGLAFDLSFNGCGSALYLSIVAFGSKNEADSGILAVGELFMLLKTKPIAFVAFEWDIDKEKFGVMAGVCIDIAFAPLTGTIYFGNKPWTFAIGQLADQSTWLTLKVNYGLWIAIKSSIAVCVQIVDGGPKGFGLVFSLSASANWGIGSFILWGTFGLIYGTWKTGAETSGLEFWIELGFKIRVFWVFSFGAEILLKITYIGRHPWYVSLHARIEIDTPWFLPDVTFTIDKTYREPLPFDTATVTQSLSQACAIDIAQKATRLLVPGFAGALGDAAFLYTFNQLKDLAGARITDPHLRTDIPIISVDASIAIDLAQPAANDSAIATSTWDGAIDSGVQQVSDLHLRYGLQSIAVRRAPRFGPTAGVWTELIGDAATRFSIGGAAPETITFCWDPDLRADGKLAPKRLRINSSSPYSFITSSAQLDEEAARNDADFPCCSGHAQHAALPAAHVLEFGAIAAGARLPRTERFNGLNGAWWTWATPLPPTVTGGDPIYPGGRTAGLAPPGSIAIGSADLPFPAVSAQLECWFDEIPGRLLFEAYSGLDRIAYEIADLHAAGAATLNLSSGAVAGMTRLLLRVELDAPPASSPLGQAAPAFAASAQIRIYRVSYVVLADAIRYAGAVQRCNNAAAIAPPGSDAAGQLAFLPNHDYEIVVTSAIEVGARSTGARSLQLAEAVYFRTKGLPGLNATDNVGDDIRRHVDMTYPVQRAIPIYRREPCVLAFENSLSSVLPIDRTPLPGDPPERAQMFPLELNVDRVVSLDGLKRLTVPDDDWIWAHRVNPYPRRFAAATPGFARAAVRHARSQDPLVLRHEALKLASAECGPAQLAHASQVLLHAPIDGAGLAGPWEPATGYRATVRQRGGAFAERSGFDEFDQGAFTSQADGGAAPMPWRVDALGNLLAPRGGGGRQYATCGEPAWDHLQVHSNIDLRSARAAGLGVSVGGGPAVAAAYLATVEIHDGGHELVVRMRDASGEHVLGSAPVRIDGAFLLTVTSYDDTVRATVGEVSVSGTRGAVRGGRVALIADGRAAFAGIAIGAIDIYTFEFVTSAYHSFEEHLGSYDGALPTLDAGAFGGKPVAAVSLLAAHAAEFPALLTNTADPQQRQQLFDSLVSSLAIGLQKSPTAVTVALLTDAGGTFGFLLQSPEPVSLSRDVTLTLTRHLRTWMPDSMITPLPPGPAPGLHDIARARLTLDSIGMQALSARDRPGPAGTAASALSHVRFSQGEATAADAVARADLAGLAGLDPAVAALLPGDPGRPAAYGHWVEEDIPVSFVPFANGAETSILILSEHGVPLSAGTYRLRAVLDRDRWRASAVTDPQQHYHDEQTITLAW